MSTAPWLYSFTYIYPVANMNALIRLISSNRLSLSLGGNVRNRRRA